MVGLLEAIDKAIRSLEYPDHVVATAIRHALRGDDGRVRQHRAAGDLGQVLVPVLRWYPPLRAGGHELDLGVLVKQADDVQRRALSDLLLDGDDPRVPKDDAHPAGIGVLDLHG